MHLLITSRTTLNNARAFSLIEMIGVISIVAIMMSVVGPNLIRKVVDNNSVREMKSLQTLSDGLQRHIQTQQTIPGGGTWSTLVSAAVGLSPNEVSYADPSDTVTSRRIYIVDPRFTPATAADPVFTMPSAGSLAPTNARVMIVSSTKRGLAVSLTAGKAANTVASRTAFDNVWNWTLDPFTKAPPTGWPATWSGNGQHLHVQRANLANLFVHVTVSNPNYPTNIPFAKFNQAATYPFDVTNAVDSYYLQGTVVRLYRHDEPYVTVPANPDELNITHVLQSDVNFLYEGAPARWKVQ